jgi:hypothetical protein
MLGTLDQLLKKIAVAESLQRVVEVDKVHQEAVVSHKLTEVELRAKFREEEAERKKQLQADRAHLASSVPDRALLLKKRKISSISSSSESTSSSSSSSSSSSVLSFRRPHNG